jgi:hypothetical protein
METLGSLCDKLTIVKLKQYHSASYENRSVLKQQETNLKKEIDMYITDAVAGRIKLEVLSAPHCKVYSGEIPVTPITNIGEAFNRLARVNIAVWHLQEKVFGFEDVPEDKRVGVIKSIAVLNVERNDCIDRINTLFSELIKE